MQISAATGLTWTAKQLRDLYSTTEPPEAKKARQSRIRLLRDKIAAAVQQEYSKHRDEPDRVVRTLAALRRRGYHRTATGAPLDRCAVKRIAAPVLVAQDGQPRIRAECRNGPRPCPWSICRHHLAEQWIAGLGNSSKRVAALQEQHGITLQQLQDGNYDSLPCTCLLDLVESQGPVDEDLPLFAATADNAAIAAQLACTRETVQQTIKRAIQAIAEQDPELGRLLLRGYHGSKTRSRATAWGIDE